MSAYRKPAEVGQVIELKAKPQFLDERCAACGHDKGNHFDDGKCLWCKSERRCQRFVWKEQEQ